MIIMGKNKKRQGAVSLILNKLGSKTEKLQEENQNSMADVQASETAEQDHSQAIDNTVSELIEAFETKNSGKLKSALRSFVLTVTKAEK